MGLLLRASSGSVNSELESAKVKLGVPRLLPETGGTVPPPAGVMGGGEFVVVAAIRILEERESSNGKRSSPGWSVMLRVRRAIEEEAQAPGAAG